MRLLRLSGWGELDSLHQSLDLVSLALASDRRDRGNDVGITQVIIQVDFDFWTILWVWRCASSGLLQDEGSQFAEITSKGSGIIDDDIDEFSVGIGTQPQLDRQIGCVGRTGAAADGHADIEIPLLGSDFEGHHKEDQ